MERQVQFMKMTISMLLFFCLFLPQIYSAGANSISGINDTRTSEESVDSVGSSNSSETSSLENSNSIAGNSSEFMESVGSSNSSETSSQENSNSKEKACPNNFQYFPEIDQCLYFNSNPRPWEEARQTCAQFKNGSQLVIVRDSTKQEVVARFAQLNMGNADCPKGWVRFLGTDRCFYISSGSETYQTGKDFCESQNAQLAPPLTCDEHIELAALLTLQRPACRNGGNCDDFWLGIESQDERYWRTARGFEIENSRQCQQWAKGFPRVTDGGCVIMSLRGYRNRGVWRNTNCNNTFKYVCITCPNDFEYLPEINECLMFIAVNTTWSQARIHCPTLKRIAQLLTIQDPMKQAVLKKYLKKHLNKLPPEECSTSKWAEMGKIMWMGAQTQDPNQCKTPYFWKPVGAPNTPFSYTDWFPGVPNCGLKDENCAALPTSQEYNYRWEDIPCTEALCYVCEF